MDSYFWHQRWEDNRIGFHEGKPNQLFVSYLGELSLAENYRVFVPLCGKTRDIEWLLGKGFQVVGVELSELAIDQLFVELGIEPVITQQGNIKRYSATNITIFVGDFFELDQELLGDVDAVLDRAALVALPAEMRVNYAKHLMSISNKAPLLLITFDYDQSLMSGPPFSVSAEEVKRHYDADYTIRHLESVALEGGFRNVAEVHERIWLLTQ